MCLECPVRVVLELGASQTGGWSGRDEGALKGEVLASFPAVDVVASASFTVSSAAVGTRFPSSISTFGEGVRTSQ